MTFLNPPLSTPQTMYPRPLALMSPEALTFLREVPARVEAAGRYLTSLEYAARTPVGAWQLVQDTFGHDTTVAMRAVRQHLRLTHVVDALYGTFNNKRSKIWVSQQELPVYETRGLISKTLVGSAEVLGLGVLALASTCGALYGFLWPHKLPYAELELSRPAWADITASQAALKVQTVSRCHQRAETLQEVVHQISVMCGGIVKVCLALTAALLGVIYSALHCGFKLQHYYSPAQRHQRFEDALQLAEMRQKHYIALHQELCDQLLAAQTAYEGLQEHLKTSDAAADSPKPPALEDLPEKLRAAHTQWLLAQANVDAFRAQSYETLAAERVEQAKAALAAYNA